MRPEEKTAWGEILRVDGEIIEMCGKMRGIYEMLVSDTLYGDEDDLSNELDALGEKTDSLMNLREQLLKKMDFNKEGANDGR